MSLTLIKEAVVDSNFSSNTKQTISMLESIMGKQSARRMVESYQVSPEDYSQWLEVIKGYAADEGINIKSKAAFADTAFAVLENDPAPLAEDMKEAIVNTLWAQFKVAQQHSKVERAGRAQEEEEQLKYALRKMRGKSEENEESSKIAELTELKARLESQGKYRQASAIADELRQAQRNTRKAEENEESGFAQMFKTSSGMEEEEYDDVDDTEGYDYDDTDTKMPTGEVSHLTDLLTTGRITYEQFRTKMDKLNGFKRRGRSASRVDDYEFEDEEVNDLPDEFDPRDMDGSVGRESSIRSRNKMYPPRRDEVGTFDEDRNIMQRGNQMRKSRNLGNFDQSGDEGMDRDINLMRHAKSQPTEYFVANENEEQVDYASPFHKGQLVSNKKDGNTYKVEIPDGPGDAVGVMVGGRIKMVPAKDLEVPHAAEEEESTSKQPKETTSFLHDILTGVNSRQNLAILQKKMEDEGANSWTAHHAKLPKNPHPKGSLAAKHWQKGVDNAAKEIWSPKVAIDPKSAKAKLNKKKK